jgi:hypothetical protein
MPKLNAVDAISPAFNLMKADLFKPFRWGFWVRIGILGFFTGEMSAGGGCNFNFPSNWNTHRHDQFTPPQFIAAPPFGHWNPHALIAALPFIIGAALLIGLILMYVGSVFRFTLLEAVLNAQVSIRDGWERWQQQGTQFFIFRLLLGLAFLCIVGIVVLFIVALVGVASFTHNPGALGAGAILGIVLGALTVAIFAIPFVLVYLFAKDFAVPVMALEGVTFGEAWRKVWAMIKNEPGSTAAYVGMKIVLTIAAGIIFGIIIFIAVLFLILPIGGLGVVSVLAGKAAGLTWTPLTITLIVAAAVILVGLLLFVISVISAPVSVFFPAYGLYFFAGRYQPLHDRLFPPPPPTPPLPETPPEAPPVPPIMKPPPEPLGS